MQGLHGWWVNHGEVYLGKYLFFPGLTRTKEKPFHSRQVYLDEKSLLGSSHAARLSMRYHQHHSTNVK